MFGFSSSFSLCHIALLYLTICHLTPHPQKVYLHKFRKKKKEWSQSDPLFPCKVIYLNAVSWLLKRKIIPFYIIKASTGLCALFPSISFLTNVSNLAEYLSTWVIIPVLHCFIIYSLSNPQIRDTWERSPKLSPSCSRASESLGMLILPAPWFRPFPLYLNIKIILPDCFPS